MLVVPAKSRCVAHTGSVCPLLRDKPPTSKLCQSDERRSAGPPLSDRNCRWRDCRLPAATAGSKKALEIRTHPESLAAILLLAGGPRAPSDPHWPPRDIFNPKRWLAPNRRRRATRTRSSWRVSTARPPDGLGLAPSPLHLQYVMGATLVSVLMHFRRGLELAAPD
jgi:hypothetical protein